MTKVTLIFKTPDRSKHSSQTFTVKFWEVHSSYNFLRLVFDDDSQFFFNLADLFSFQVAPIVE